MQRRRFIKLGMSGLALAGLRGLAAQPRTQPVEVKLRIGAQTGQIIPEDFVGLSYESAQLGHAEFFSAANGALIEMFKRLSSHGVLRIGGNTSEYTEWSSRDMAGQSTLPPAVGPDTGQRAKSSTVITPSAIHNLRAFLDATGWTCIYGLNLARGTPQKAAEEAKFVTASLGPKLIALQMGNEPNLFRKNSRPENYSYAEYIAEWRRFADAIRKAVPDARFAGPDAAGAADWVAKFAADRPAGTVLLTGHYYAEGPPTDPRMNIEYLLHPNAQLLRDIPIQMQAAKEANLPFRMAEGNSCYWGGKPGVSDTFASALWVADYMLQVAQAGYSGVNLHGGGNGVYTPIAGDAQNGFTARPIYHGMELAKEFAGANLLKTELNANDANVTAYAADRSGTVLVAFFNKQPAAVSLALSNNGLGALAGPFKTKLLTAPAIDSKQNVEFVERQLSAKSTYQVPPYTGVLFTGKRKAV